MPEWDKFIEETAYHVLSFSEFKTKNQYIGSSMSPDGKGTAGTRTYKLCGIGCTWSLTL
jgi:hypothetical protein